MISAVACKKCQKEPVIVMIAFGTRMAYACECGTQGPSILIPPVFNMPELADMAAQSWNKSIASAVENTSV